MSSRTDAQLLMLLLCVYQCVSMSNMSLSNKTLNKTVQAKPFDYVLLPGLVIFHVAHFPLI